MTFLNESRPPCRFYEGGRGQFKTEDRLQLVDRADARGRAVAMRFVHDQHEIVEAREVVEIAFADFLTKTADAWTAPSANLRIDL